MCDVRGDDGRWQEWQNLVLIGVPVAHALYSTVPDAADNDIYLHSSTSTSTSTRYVHTDYDAHRAFLLQHESHVLMCDQISSQDSVPILIRLESLLASHPTSPSRKAPKSLAFFVSQQAWIRFQTAEYGDSNTHDDWTTSSQFHHNNRLTNQDPRFSIALTKAITKIS